MAPTARKLSLDDHQRFVLMKFRRVMSDVTKPHHNDEFLVRFLIARKWDLTAAEKMLRKSLKWRDEIGVDGPLKSWEPPEVIEMCYPSGTSGFDKDGAPVCIVPFAGFDVVGLLHACTKQDLIKRTVQELEMYIDIASKTGANNVTVIFDMEGFNLRQYAWRPAAELVISLLQIYESNYPEILKCCYIINAPSVFAIAWNVVKRFLNELTINKIQIFKSDRKKWQKAILLNVDPDNLPKHFGGNLCDPDGNPRYTTKIRQGSKVPKSYYRKSFEDGPEASTYTKAVIKKGGKLTLDFLTAEEGMVLRWDFKTDAHDIRFGVSMTDIEGKTTHPVELRRVPAHQVEESGVITCQAPATYTVIFDNSYSVLRSKKLHYSVICVKLEEKLGELGIPIENEAEDLAEDTKNLSLQSGNSNNVSAVTAH